MDCYKCEGEGTIGVECERCSGNGRVTERCIPCFGSGMNESEEPCEYCHEGGDCGRGDVTIGCPDCGGQGSGEGDDCGDGVLEKKCTVCSGTGKQ